MPLQKIAFIILSVLALGSAILVITRRNAVHSLMWLIVTLFSVGGIYLMLHAEFLFAVQIILYVGGIMVLFLFVIMLVNLDVAAKQAQFSRQWLLGLATVVVLTAELIYGLYRGRASFALAPTRRPWAWRFTRTTCCRLRSRPSCCSWPWWERWSWRRGNSNDSSSLLSVPGRGIVHHRRAGRADAPQRDHYPDVD